MTARGLLLVVLSAFSTVVANLMLRKGVLRAGGLTLSDSSFRELIALAREPLFVTGFILYGVAALIWFRVLSTEDLSTSYPLLVSITFVFVTLGAVLIFNEHVSWQKIVGMGFILTGFCLVARA